MGCPSGTSLYIFDDLSIKKLVSLGVIKKYIISSGSLSSQTVDDRQLNALVIHYDKTRQGVGLRVRQWVKTLSVGRHAITGERQT